MKHCILIIDGAAGWPLPQHGGKTCLELAHTPNLDAMTGEGLVGMAQTVPQGMEPSSACACMSILGYDPRVYYLGRSIIEARSMGIPVDDGDAVFRCNLVAIECGRMLDYSAGHITSAESRDLITALQVSLGNETILFYPGVSYRSICRIRGREDTLLATCTPPHDIPGQAISEHLPTGQGSELLQDIMARSQDVLRNHRVNQQRISQGNTPATMVWLFWGSGKAPDLPPFRQLYGLEAAMTSGVDLLRGLAMMAGINNLDIRGVTDGMDNDYSAQASGAIRALRNHDLVVIHVEAPDEAGHSGSIDQKIEAIEMVDRHVVGQLLSWHGDALRILAMPDHPTPIEFRTHTADPVPFVLWGPGFSSCGAAAFTEAEAKRSGVFVEAGHTLISRLLAKN